MLGWPGLAFALALSALVAACDPGVGVGELCRGDGECASGRCGSFYDGGADVCLASCDGSADCPAGLACGTRADGARLCVEPCGFSVDGYVCIDDAPVACELAGEERDCVTCGCPTGQFCDGTCQPRRDVGEPCRRADECASNNCSVASSVEPAEPGQCWVAAGAACTDDNCGSCDPVATGDVCAQRCNRNQLCAGDERCVREGDSADPGFFCRPLCERVSDCARGWTCEAIANTDYATCFPPVTCEVGAADACPGCTDVPGASFDLCAYACIPGLTGCPLGWICTGIAPGDYRCLPPS